MILPSESSGFFLAPLSGNTRSGAENARADSLTDSPVGYRVGAELPPTFSLRGDRRVFISSFMIFRITRRESPFVQVDRGIVENPKLSWKAKGLMAYLLSRPDDWRIMMADLEKRSTDGSTAIRSALIELRDAGYAQLDRARCEDGTLEGTFWNIYETPRPLNGDESKVTEIEVSRKTVKPNYGQSNTTNKDRKNNKDIGARPRNLLFDALCAVDMSDPVEASKASGGRVGKALSQIKRMTPEATPEEIVRRATNYRASWPNVALTATALAAHWAKFGVAHEPGSQNGHAKPDRKLSLVYVPPTEEQLARGFR